MAAKVLMYRSAAWWVDVFAPELSMGLRTDDEILDAFEPENNTQGVTVSVSDSKPIATPPAKPVDKFTEAFAGCADLESLDEKLNELTASASALNKPKIIAAYNSKKAELGV